MPLLFERDFDPVTVFTGHAGAMATARLADGRLLIVVHDASVNSVRPIYFDEFGTPAGPFIELLHHGPISSVVALPSGGFALVYGTLGSDREIYMELYDAQGAAVGGPIHVNTVTRFNQVTPQAALLESGRILVTWADQSALVADADYAIKARIFESNGTPVGGEFLVNTTVAGDQHHPDVVPLAGGGFVIAWQDPASLGKFQLYNAAGNRVGAETDAPMTNLVGLSNGNFLISHHPTGTSRIFDPAGNLVTTVAGAGYVFGAIEGGFLVAGSHDLEAVYDNSGVQQGIRFDLSASPTTASVLALDDGRFVYIERGGSGVGMQYVKPDDGVLTVTPVPDGLSESTPQNNLVALIRMADAALNSSYTFSVVSDSLGGAFRIDGNRLILDSIDGLDYETAPTVSVTIAATNLNGVTSTQIVALDLTDEALEYPITASPALANTVDTTDRGLLELPSGGHVLATSAHGVDPTGTAVTVQSFDAAGNPTSPVIQVNTQTFLNQQDPDIAALAGGRFMIAWWDQGGETAGGIRYQVFDAALNKIGPEFTLNTVKNGVQIDVALQQLGSGRVLATWSDYSGIGGDTISGGIKGQLFDSAGVPVGGEFLVNSVVAGEQRKSDIVALDSGNVLVTWTSVDTATAGTLRGQLFDADGARVGGEILLESFTRDGATGSFSTQYSGSYEVAALLSGGFALAWTTDGIAGPDTDGTAVWARLFDDNGAPANAKFLVNTVPDDDQRVSGMTVLPTGELYIAWGGGGSSGRARIFDLTATRTDWVDDDTSSGTPGADVLGGGLGDDRYIVNHVGDVVIEFVGEGTDIIYSSVSYSLNDDSEVESLSTITWELTDPLNLAGNKLANQLIGNAGANRLDGRVGADTMFGREGNDVYFVDNAGDRPIEYAGQGVDVVYTSVSYALAANTDVEGLATISFEATAAINLTGNGLANNMIGNNGANQLDGKAGADTMTGRAGNDKYLVDNAGDRAFEAVGGGTDIVYSAVSFALTDGQEIEGLSTITWELTNAINLSGNKLNNYLIGNAGVNVLDGRAGNDTMQGREGADSYVFTTVLGPGNVDVILGFSAADDTIVLENNGVFVGLAAGALPASAFAIGTAAQDFNDRIIYDQATGRLFFDADGNGAGAQIQFARLDGAPIIAANDFTVI